VAHADAVSAGETLEFACAQDRPVAATTNAADKTTVRSRDLRLTVGAERSEACSYEPVVFFIFHLHPSNNERCRSNDFFVGL